MSQVVVVVVVQVALVISAATVTICPCSAIGFPDVYEGDVCKSVGGVAWTCKAIRACEKALEDLKARVRVDTCAFSRDAKRNPIVCCEPSSSRNPSPPAVKREAGRKALEKCKDYAEHVFIELPSWWEEDGNKKHDTCKQDLKPLVVGGQDALPQEFPHMAQIGYQEGPTGTIDWRCGGSLISERFVLSAAHCNSESGEPAKWVRLGDYDKKSDQDEAESHALTETVAIAERITHPGYKEPSIENDIVLYRLAANVRFNEFVRPVCLNVEPVVDRVTWATGWGHTEFGGKESAVLQKVNLTVVSDAKCRALYPTNANLPNGIRESMMCAGDTKGKDTCQRDSGGPLQVTHPSLYCMLTQVGITSFGGACGLLPGVYTRISHFIPWIENIVWPE